MVTNANHVHLVQAVHMEATGSIKNNKRRRARESGFRKGCLRDSQVCSTSNP